MTEDRGDDWVADVMRSPLDHRVWCVVLPETDMMTGALHASTSLRRCKAYAAAQVAHYLDVEPADIVWTLTDDGAWSATLPPTPGAT